MAGAIDHHRSVHYRVNEYTAVDGFQVTRSPDGREITVTGACPGCGGLTSTTWTYGSGNQYKGIRDRFRSRTMDPPADRSGTVCCDCGHSHEHRPDSAVFLGCGAFWRIELS